jgi:hypothetical protein
MSGSGRDVLEILQKSGTLRAVKEGKGTGKGQRRNYLLPKGGRNRKMADICGILHSKFSEYLLRGKAGFCRI